ncbi:MAG: TatD family hydrolase [Saprospiraceae bacterium]|nr:TatD family hydrolase [Saprospiraceae bacterium]
MYIDTHAHLYVPQFDDDLEATVQRARERGIIKILMPNVDLDTIGDMHRVEQEYPDICHSMMGLHPCSVSANFESVLIEIEKWLNQRYYLAIGEIGLDLYWDKTYYEQQVEVFKIQVGWAYDRQIPVVIHSRESIDEILAILEHLALPGLKGVFHCFTGSLEQAKRIIDLDFQMGIGGVVTFKNGGLDKVLSQIELKRIILETDAPYLAPNPYRGKRNESSYLAIIGQRVAEIYQLTETEIRQRTTENALALFSSLNQPKP